jgi:uncharacterized membrane protein
MKIEVLFFIIMSVVYVVINILFILSFFDYIKTPKGFFSNGLAFVMLIPTILIGITVFIIYGLVKLKSRERKFEKININFKWPE